MTLRPYGAIEIRLLLFYAKFSVKCVCAGPVQMICSVLPESNELRILPVSSAETFRNCTLGSRGPSRVLQDVQGGAWYCHSIGVYYSATSHLEYTVDVVAYTVESLRRGIEQPANKGTKA